MNIDLDQIRNLLDIVGSTEITELTIESGEEKITIKKQTTVLTSAVEIPVAAGRSAAPIEASASAPSAAPKASEEDSNGKGLISITSPMVGTFYRASTPTAAPFVAIGDLIAPGQTVCIIEAMKLMNDLPAEVTGRIVKVCVENGTTVEYGQALFMVNPKV